MEKTEQKAWDGRWLVLYWFTQGSQPGNTEPHWRGQYIERAANHYHAALLARDLVQLTPDTHLMVMALPDSEINTVIKPTGNMEAEIPGPRWYVIGPEKDTYPPRMPEARTEKAWLDTIHNQRRTQAAAAEAKKIAA